MRHNAYAVGNPILYKVWGDDDMAPQWPLIDATPVMVIWSPIFRQYIMSITCLDYRYDAFVRPDQFRLDPALQDVTDAPSYYLQQAKTASKNFSK